MQAVYIIDAKRTPFMKVATVPGPFAAADLALHASQALLLGLPQVAEHIDQVIAGTVLPAADEANIARILSLRLGLANQVPAYTVQRNCGSGLQAIDSAVKDICLGRHDLILSCATEAMSRAPLLHNAAMVRWFAQLARAKTIGQKLAHLRHFRLTMLKPVIALKQGLTDPIMQLNMGQTAEELATRFAISRSDMDQFALASHQKAVQAQAQPVFNQIIAPIICPHSAKLFTTDNGVREHASLERLARLKPLFDPNYGTVTAGNSSQLTDGATALLLASASAVKRYQLPVKACIKSIHWAGVPPDIMGIGPVHAINQLLTQHKLSMQHIDAWEINEAFAAQVLACVKALGSDHYAQTQLGRSSAVGELPLDKLNCAGGAIAQGHPVGASAARIVLQLLQVLEHRDQRLGVASMCIGGGQGGAILVARCTEEELA